MDGQSAGGPCYLKCDEKQMEWGLPEFGAPKSLERDLDLCDGWEIVTITVKIMSFDALWAFLNHQPIG